MRIFISYRRDDSGYAAQRLSDALAERFPGEVFIDVEPTEPGVGLIGVVEHAVGSCDVVLALIGDRWLSITDRRRNRRLDDPNDLVRLEIEAALAWDVPLVMVLFQGAAAPTAEELPDSIRLLAGSPAAELSYLRWETDVDRLVQTLGQEEPPSQPNDPVGTWAGPWERETRGLPPPLPPPVMERPDAEAEPSQVGSQTSDLDSPTEAQPKRSFRAAWLLAATLAPVALIGLGAFFLLRHTSTHETATVPTPTIDGPSGWQVHRDEANGFSVAVPEGWKDLTSGVRARTSDLVKFAAGDESGNVNVVVEPVPAGTDLQTYTRAARKILFRLGARNIVATRTPVRAGPAMLVTFRATGKISAGTKGGTQYQFYLIRGARAFDITFTGKPGTSFDIALRDQIMDTFQLIG